MQESGAIELSLCGVRFRLEYFGSELRRGIESYLRPVLNLTPSKSEFGAHLRIGGKGVEILHGPSVEKTEHDSPLLELEWVLTQLCLTLQPGVPLHAGCVVYEERVVLLLAPSGGGKSTMTLAALRAGAQYVTDDLLILGTGIGHGLGRAIRFKLEPLLEARTRAYLTHMDLESNQLTSDLGRYTVPVFQGPYDTKENVKLGGLEPPIVVRVNQGRANRISRLKSLERAVILHEAVIAEQVEYDGSLGPGPTYDLTWNDPDTGFKLLSETLGDLSQASLTE